jgi:hypothetical protein
MPAGPRSLGSAERADNEETRMPAPGLSIAASKLISLGLTAKIGLGVTVATAGVAGAGAAGVLPAQANERARDAIEAVTPVEFDEPAGDHGGDNFGGVVSSDATGESDGEPGVDGSEISEMAPGAQHRPVDPGQAPAQAGAPGDVAGLDQATETPAAAHVPDDTGAPEGRSTAPATPAAPPSTVPETGGRPDAPGGQAARD